MVKSNPIIVGVMIGFAIYTVYFVYYKRMLSTKVVVNVSKKDLSKLPDGISTHQACFLLEHRYKLKDENMASTVNPSVLFHWNNLKCNEILATSVSNNEERKESTNDLSVSHKENYLPVPLQNEVDRDTEKCANFQKTYDVVPGSSWGSLPINLQREWSQLRCDVLINADIVGQTTSTSNHNKNEDQRSSSKTDPQSIISKIIKNGSNKVISNQQHTVGLAKVDKNSQDWCMETRKRYHVLPMKSWGSLPMNMIESWRSNQCDKIFTIQRMADIPLTTCPSSNLNQSLPLIAIMAATTTRKVTKPSTGNMALFSYLLPSLLRTVDCHFKYVYVLGFDKGDPFYDTDEGMATVKKWFKDNIEKPMKSNNIFISLKIVRVNNSLKKPGPVFIEMARAAFALNSDYFYRVNDDTELISHWPKIFVQALNSLVPKNIGVVGPTCNQGNQKILTHDFIHRQHMEIFNMNYYPPELVDWWMDDWISFVYGKQKTFKASGVTVIHHTGAHGQRYEVNRENEKHLISLIKDGRMKIREYLLKKNIIGDSDLEKFDNDIFSATFDHVDAPKEAYL